MNFGFILKMMKKYSLKFAKISKHNILNFKKQDYFAMLMIHLYNHMHLKIRKL